jgi:5-methylcytosine-specific restriction endonuclease McrA
MTPADDPCDAPRFDNVSAAMKPERVRAAIHAELRTAVLERDEWRCQLCGVAISHNRRAPHPLSASLDHVTPHSQGGEDTLGNLRAAHLWCNTSRGTTDASGAPGARRTLSVTLLSFRKRRDESPPTPATTSAPTPATSTTPS